MDKISINLNPQKENVPKVLLQKITSYTPLMGLSTVVILILIIVLHMFVLTKRHTYKLYSKQWEEWKPKADLIKKVKSEVAALENRKKGLQEITTPQYESALILGDLFFSLPKNIWLTRLHLQKDSVNFHGYVVKWHEDYLVSLEKFINSLKFNKVKIQKSYKTQFNGIEVLEFAIQCER